MQLAELSLFIEVARRGSFAAAARARGVDASSVSRAIAGLEAELGARLFQRTTRRLSLTETGRLYLDRVAPAVEELRLAQDEVTAARGEPAGRLRITASAAFGQMMLAPLLPAFRATLPRLGLELLLTDANLDLVADGVDLAIRLAPSYRADVVGVRLFATRYRVVAAPGWIAVHGAPSTPQALSGLACLLFDLPDYRTRWLFRREAEVVEAPVHGDLVSSSALVLRQAALDGLGPSLLADWMIDGDLAAGRLIDLFPPYEATATSFETAAWLLYPSRRHLPRKVRAAIDFLRAHLPIPADVVTREATWRPGRDSNP